MCQEALSQNRSDGTQTCHHGGVYSLTGPVWGQKLSGTARVLPGTLLGKPAWPMGGKAVLLLGHAVNTAWEQSAQEEVVKEALIPLDLFKIIFL